MAVRNVQEAFEEYERTSARVPDWQNEEAKRVHPVVREAIAEALGQYFSHAYLAGSYRRRVQTVRLHDVDIIVVLNDIDGAFSSSAHRALRTIEAASHGCELVTATEFGVRAVKLDIDGVEFTVDLVAALDDPSGEVELACFLPDEGRDEWTRARPQGQVEAAAAKNVATGGILVPATRIVKSWNIRHGDGETNLLPSYLVESILFWALEESCDYEIAVATFFRHAKAHLSQPGPSVRCPGDPENFVDERLEQERRLRGLAAVEGALAQVTVAESAVDVATKLDAWAEIFGPAFPAPSTDPNRLADALRAGDAVAADTAITADAGRELIPARSWSKR